MEVIAKSDFLRISPRKLNLVSQTIKGLKATYALEVLKSLNKKAANFLILTLKQGIGNAVNNFSLDKESLVIKKIEVGRGTILKRGQPVARGQWHPILKRTSNLKIFLEGDERNKIQKSKIQISKKTKERKKLENKQIKGEENGK